MIYNCDHCNVDFTNNIDFETHREASVGRLACKFCGMSFSSNCSEMKHLKTFHNGNVDVKCYKCHKLFRSKNKFSSLLLHIKDCVIDEVPTKTMDINDCFIDEIPTTKTEDTKDCGIDKTLIAKTEGIKDCGNDEMITAKTDGVMDGGIDETSTSKTEGNKDCLMIEEINDRIDIKKKYVFSRECIDDNNVETFVEQGERKNNNNTKKENLTFMAVKKEIKHLNTKENDTIKHDIKKEPMAMNLQSANFQLKNEGKNIHNFDINMKIMNNNVKETHRLIFDIKKENIKGASETDNKRKRGRPKGSKRKLKETSTETVPKKVKISSTDIKREDIVDSFYALPLGDKELISFNKRGGRSKGSNNQSSKDRVRGIPKKKTFTKDKFSIKKEYIPGENDDNEKSASLEDSCQNHIICNCVKKYDPEPFEYKNVEKTHEKTNVSFLTNLNKEDKPSKGKRPTKLRDSCQNHITFCKCAENFKIKSRNRKEQMKEESKNKPNRKTNKNEKSNVTREKNKKENSQELYHKIKTIWYGTENTLNDESEEKIKPKVEVDADAENKETTFNCGQCNVDFTIQSNFEEHREKSFRWLACKYCGMSFSTDCGQMNHLKTFHIGNKDVKCYKCHKPFQSKTKFSSLVHHIKECEINETSTKEDINDCGNYEKLTTKSIFNDDSEEKIIPTVVAENTFVFVMKEERDSIDDNDSTYMNPLAIL